MIWRERVDGVGEDTAADDVGPVVEDMTEEVDGCAWKLCVSSKAYRLQDARGTLG